MEIKLEDIVNQLNDILKLDKEFITNLVTSYEPMNTKLASSDNIVCAHGTAGYNAGVIGLLNGLIYNNINKTTRIAAVYNSNQELLGFKLVEV